MGGGKRHVNRSEQHTSVGIAVPDEPGSHANRGVALPTDRTRGVFAGDTGECFEGGTEGDGASEFDPIGDAGGAEHGGNIVAGDHGQDGQITIARQRQPDPLRNEDRIRETVEIAGDADHGARGRRDALQRRRIRRAAAGIPHVRPAEPDACCTCHRSGRQRAGASAAGNGRSSRSSEQRSSTGYGASACCSAMCGASELPRLPSSRTCAPETGAGTFDAGVSGAHSFTKLVVQASASDVLRSASNTAQRGSASACP